MKKRLLTIILSGCVVLAACSPPAASTPTDNPTTAPSSDSQTGVTDSPADGNTVTSGTTFADPVEAARAFVNTIYTDDDDAVSDLFCAELAEESPLTEIAGVPQIPGATFDTSSLTYTVISQEGDQAVVEVSGTVKVILTVGGQSTTQESDFTTLTLPLKNEDGWKYCPS